MTPNEREIAGCEVAFRKVCANASQKLTDVNDMTPCSELAPETPHGWWLEMMALESVLDEIGNSNRGAAIDATRALLGRLETPST